MDASVDLRTTTDYAGFVQAMTAEQVDLGYFGGVSYILAHHRANAKPIVVGSKSGMTDWHSVFIAHESTAVSSIDDLKRSADSLDLAFGDPLSTSGTVMPAYYFRRRHDLFPARAFKSLTHVEAYDAVAGTVSGGNTSVGALNARIYNRLVETRSVDETVIEVWRTPGFADYPWAVNGTLEEETVAAIRDAFIGLDEKESETTLDQQNVDKYVTTGHEEFGELGDAVRMVVILNDDDD
ncbi:phosphate/phosphite/phosphonate ABC transporter substrate-binding protein [Natrinema saccharevitans]|uniref:phosphate/phosphite/phosphonate ABC transporter substrate-binding protein n=1 Tax=Natrinema saccharevitans TaxID=301967 RepID=UPI001FE5F4E8|nr:phosphate/phosphite/phosphonate ABC transporter substrate-binding protein [Natrinema saccharevitans]